MGHEDQFPLAGQSGRCRSRKRSEIYITDGAAWIDLRAGDLVGGEVARHKERLAHVGLGDVRHDRGDLRQATADEQDAPVADILFDASALQLPLVV
jgi:hypothetical protein